MRFFKSKQSRLPVLPKLVAIAIGSGLMSTTAIVLGDQAVMAGGILVDYGDVVNRNPGAPFGGDVNYTIDDLCAASPILGMAMQDMVNGVEREAINAGAPINLYTLEAMGAPSRYDVEEGMANARDEICDTSEPEAYVSPFVILYSSCRMVMYTRDNAMAINVEPGSQGNAWMLLADHNSRQVIRTNLTRSITLASENPIIGRGWGSEMQLIPSNQTETIGDFQTEHFTFDSTGGLGKDGVGALSEADVESGALASDPGMIGNMISVTTKGDVWIADDVEGIEIARSFYETLSGVVHPGENASFFRGLIDNNVSMLRKGMPILVESETSSKVLGRTMISGKSKSLVTKTMVIDVAPDGCVERPLPEGYELVDIDEQINQALGAGQGNSEEMAAAMQQYNDAMAGMTPEQQEMLANFGLDDMLGGLGGAAAASGGAPANQSTAASAQRAGGTGNAGSSSSTVSSADLTTDNLVESVQKHLDALGYDPGSTDGSESVMTEVAISQFQAENGLPVTGKVTPQLLGILSATVDK